ncbi:hypothetical protein C798_19770 [Herbaspirillum rubrisubalbicans Os34]|uniref:Uncharacterized protein n=2 Tax=Herbaspirillum rubrisubalbicans TaxID=80842 RepID=A0A6M3ZUS1_9BURK|nr:hypothetical protein C798_19770 [Herbaspirillum rubrisubalbicans Os34]
MEKILWKKDMLSRSQWQWAADHHKGVKRFFLIVFWVLLAIYFYNFLNVFWWNNKIFMPYYSEGSLMEHLKCFDGESRDFFIDRRPDIEPLGREDASLLLLENYDTTIFGSEVLKKRPECLGAYISYTAGRTEPYAILVVDRKTGENVFRITYLRDYLKR